MATNCETDDFLVALELFRSDVELLQNQQKGKQRAGAMTDQELALSIFLAEVAQSEQILLDRRIAESHADAIFTDEAAIAELTDAEARVANDRNVALEIERLERSGEGVNGFQIIGVQNDDKSDGDCDNEDEFNDLVNVLSQTIISSTSSRFFSPGPSQTPGFLRQALAESRFTTRVCNTCTDRHPVSYTIASQCGHIYCRDCICQLFVYTSTDETLYPPRCCRIPFPVSTVLKWMSEPDAERFRQAAREFESTDRTYCSNPQCGVFLQSGRNVVVCHVCWTRTCGQCKAADHGVLDCPSDAGLQSVLRIADETGWKRCTRCRTMVELGIGCNHITCKCGAQWCYLCSAPWKTCTCARWQEENLIARAEEAVDRQVPLNVVLDAIERARRVLDMRQQLEEDDDNCAHLRR